MDEKISHELLVARTASRRASAREIESMNFGVIVVVRRFDHKSGRTRCRMLRVMTIVSRRRLAAASMTMMFMVVMMMVMMVMFASVVVVTA